jgi:hypothetical protein
MVSHFFISKINMLVLLINDHNMHELNCDGELDSCGNDEDLYQLSSC